MKKVVRLNESDIRRMVKESVYKILKESINSIDFENSDEYYRVDIHEPNSGNDIDSEYFDNEQDAYAYAKEQCYGQELQADIYYCEDSWEEITNISDFAYADWNWVDCVGFVDGQLNQF